MSDQAQISKWAVNEVNEAVALGFMNGHGNGIFAPKSNMTRAESAQAMLNLLNNFLYGQSYDLEGMAVR